MKKVIIYTCCLCSLLYISACRKNGELPDLRESYSYRESKPFGSLIANRILQYGYPGNYIQVLKEPFAKSARMFSDTNAVYFSVSRNMFASEDDATAVLDFVYEGNTAFFAARVFDSGFLARLYCSITPADERKAIPSLLYRNTATRVISGIHTSSDSFHYFYMPFRSFFSETNNRYCRIAGYNEEGKPNCIVFFWGKGKLFLHTDPRAFSNYFLLTGNNYRYMQELIQVMNPAPRHVYWDDYYNRHNYRENSANNKNALSEIFRYPALKAAFLLLCSTLVVYLLFGTKRKQRIIRKLERNRNSSVAFTETIARLYLQEHDNRHIADKMITYFREYIRSGYYLFLSPDSTEFVSALSRKSGVPEDYCRELMRTIVTIHSSESINDQQLLTLNEQIQQFYKNRK